MDINLKDQAKDLCYREIEFWDRFLDYLIELDNQNEVDFAKSWRQYFKDHPDASLKLAELDLLMKITIA